MSFEPGTRVKTMEFDGAVAIAEPWLIFVPERHDPGGFALTG